MAVDWNADGILMWKKEAVKKQQSFCDLLGKLMWREFEPSHYGNLKREIGFALFGVPEEEPCAILNEGTGYTNEKLKEINKIFVIIKNCMQKHKNPMKICVSFLFVFGKIEDIYITVPVIRIPHFKENINLFIDSCGRVYEGWQDYLDSNTIPECVLCYPRNGVYSAVNGAVEVEFGISPAGQSGAKVLQVFDTAATILNAAATGAQILGLFVPLPSLVKSGAGKVSKVTRLYSAGRNIQTLVDRHKHQQSIGLDSAVARNCWFGIGGAVMDTALAASMAVAVNTVQAGATMSLAGQIAIKSVAISSCVLNGLALCNGIANIIVKVVNKEKITALEVFQFASAILFFTNSVISTREAFSLINSMGKNSSGESSGATEASMSQISKIVEPTNTFNSVPGDLLGCSSTVSTIEGGSLLSLSFCREVGRKLIEITKSLLRGLTGKCNYMLEVRPLLHQYWESWNKEMDVVVDAICRAFGVKHWSELVMKVCRPFQSDDIRAAASTAIAEKGSLVECESTAIPSDNSAFVGTDDGPNRLVDGETQTYESYYDEIANIQAGLVDRQMCRNPADFCRYMTFICKFVKSELQKKMSHYEKSWEMVKRFNPDANIEDFKKQYGISGNPNNHFLQEVFNEFKEKEQDAFTLLQLTYLKQNADTSAQEVENGQDSLAGDVVRYYAFYSMRGLASNGMPSEQQYREMAAKWMGQPANMYSIHMSDNGDTAVIQVNDASDVITVQCWPEDDKVSGIAAVLHTASE